ncbi:MAG: hypothetical protein BRD30_06265 [Bacteroidetes bacterium QH_2_63_10]|nr:MAG: hypothetical protein BRD30_06265 [Bacteroidetes bacterium QH_2_63_10]
MRHTRLSRALILLALVPGLAGLVLGNVALLLVAGAIAVLLARRFPDEATDVMVRLTQERALMRADGHTTFQVNWSNVAAVHLRDNGETLELVVDRLAVHPLRPKPPVLTTVDHGSERSRLRLDLSDTDVPRSVLLSFLRGTSAIPFSISTQSHPVPADESTSA